MAKLVFPSVAAPYRGFIGEVRGWVNRMATFSDRASGATVDLLNTLRPLVSKVNAALVVSGGTQTGVTMTGTAGAGKTATFTVVGGVITAISFA